MASDDPRAVIDESPMTTRQWIVVAIMVMLNALDGFDVLSSAFAAPGISQEWGVPRAELGIVLSAELIGMGVGSVILGGFADKVGRKPAMLVCLVFMAVFMYLASAAQDVTPLMIWRFMTGIGIGGMLAATNAVIAESTSKSSRSVALALYVIGYPLGAVIGGIVSQTWLLVAFDWRAVFLFGAVVTAAMIPIVILLVPETPAFHTARRKGNALEKVNRSLATLRKPAVSALPPVEEASEEPKITDILAKPALRRTTLLLAFGYMFHTVTFYYILKWAVQIVADVGYPNPVAASVLTWANIGGALGGFLFGFVMQKFDLRWPTIFALLLGSVAVAAFGFHKEQLWAWQAATFATGFFTNSAIVGFYAAFARGFPAYARATGTGFVLGVGRFGAAGSPIMAGLLFEVLGNQQLLVVSCIMASGSILALILFAMLPLDDPEKAASQV